MALPPDSNDTIVFLSNKVEVLTRKVDTLVSDLREVHSELLETSAALGKLRETPAAESSSTAQGTAASEVAADIEDVPADDVETEEFETNAELQEPLLEEEKDSTLLVASEENGPSVLEPELADQNEESILPTKVAADPEVTPSLKPVPHTEALATPAQPEPEPVPHTPSPNAEPPATNGITNQWPRLGEGIQKRRTTSHPSSRASSEAGTTPGNVRTQSSPVVLEEQRRRTLGLEDADGFQTVAPKRRFRRQGEPVPAKLQALNQVRLGNVQPGAKVQGKVRSLKEFGVFVDIGAGRDGLLHISSVKAAVQQKQNPEQDGQPKALPYVRLSDYYKLGETITVEVIKLEPNRIELAPLVEEVQIKA